MPTINGVIDLRSDTLTQPSAEMVRAMAAAEVGDDVWGEDPTVQRLERAVASVAGKASGVYCPSGTMCNLIAVLTHCQLSPHRGPSEIIVGDAAHMTAYESGNASVIAGAFARQLPNETDGTIALARIEAALRESFTEDVHYPATKMVALENTHNKRGGAVVPLAYCWAVRELVQKFPGVALHCDGARLWNAATALGKRLDEVAAPFDTVSLCLSKGLGAPIGSVLVGPAPFITMARRYRKALGGGMRQAGYIAAAGLFAVERNFPLLGVDHAAARRIGAELAKHGFDVLPVSSNIVIWRCPVPGAGAQFTQFCAERFNVKLSTMGPDLVRAVPHIGNNHDADFAVIIRACLAAKAHMTAPKRAHV
jgi:threonine aldolase